jgi:peptidoglycan/xylan/chitin deacetylase (PgdA/CDA1 family)
LGQLTESISTEKNTSFEVVSLVYHRFGDERYPSTNTSSEALEAQMAYLQQQGFYSYTASELIGNQTILHSNEKKVLLTVDDGYVSFLKHGWPIFKKYGMKVTLFVNTESVGWQDYLTWAQINQLMREGVEIGNHSHEHRHFVNHSKANRALKFKEDLNEANYLFKEHTGVIPNVYAYPYGEYSQELSQELQDNGCLAAFAQHSGVFNNGSNPFGIPRFSVAGSFITLEQFKAKVNMGALPVQTDDQWPVIVGAEKKIQFKIRLSDGFVPSGINCFVNGEPSQQVYRNKDGVLQFELEVPRTQRRTLVTITTKNQSGTWCWFSKLIIDPSVDE